MSAINPANIKRTIYYLQRNGLRSTWYAVRERLEDKKVPPYVYEPPTEAQLEKQRETVREKASQGVYDGITFSIVVPAYRTPPQYLGELIASVQAQSYPFWELILADATEDDSVKTIVEEFSGGQPDDRQSVRYVRLSKNAGISGNTNEALEYVRNSYIGLLDHDDLLTPDALFKMAEAIRRITNRQITAHARMEVV
ncbi:MAG: glycosyltransferase, partial [Acetatifactor sp.]|nr:glycosyltransferase [Acetatifactor sp.]